MSSERTFPDLDSVSEHWRLCLQCTLNYRFVVADQKNHGFGNVRPVRLTRETSANNAVITNIQPQFLFVAVFQLHVFTVLKNLIYH